MMRSYTACRDCGGLLLITRPDDTVHPCCAPKATKAEQLAQDWLAAIRACDEQIVADIQAAIDDLDSRAPRLLDAALRYTSWGWPVFPLKPKSKQPATAHGFKDATTDTDRIRAWWTRHPTANIGLPTGQRFDVIDIDPPHGATSLTQLIDAEAMPDTHGRVTTASGGAHLYIRPTGKGNTAGIRPGIDYRGIGGYVVAPPSTLGTPQRAWCWNQHPSPLLTGQGDSYGHG